MKNQPNFSIFALLCFLTTTLEVLLLPGTSRAASISCGQTASGSLTTAGQSDLYTFSATSGERVSVAFVGYAIQAGDAAQADIYDSVGNFVSSLGGWYNPSDKNLTLTNSGVYKIWIHDASYANTGNYTLGIQSVTDGGCDGIGIACDQIVTNQVGATCEMVSYSLQGTLGQIMSIAFVGYAAHAGDAAQADVYSPSGNFMTTLGGWYGPLDTNLLLNATGTYTIIVHDASYANTGNYALGIQSVTGGGCGGTAIACDQIISNQINATCEMASYGLEGASGQTMSIAFVGYAAHAGDVAQADIYNPSGAFVSTLGGWYGPLDANVLLEATGTYTIIVHDASYANTGNYTLGIQSVTGNCGSIALPCGETITNSLAQIAQITPYTFVAVTGQVESISFVGYAAQAGNAAQADVYNSQAELISTLGGWYNPAHIQVTLTNTGVYTILVHDASYSHTGTYTIYLTPFPNGCGDPPAVSVTPTNLEIYPGSSATLTATASGPSPLYYQWLFDNNQIMGATNPTYNIANVQANNIGIYQVVVSNPGGSITAAPPATLYFEALQLGMRTAGKNIVLTWPTNATGFTLQMTTNLTPPIAWSNVIVTPIVINGQNVLSNSVSGPQQFFRLTQ